VVVAGLLLVMVLGVVQFGLWFYGRTVVTGAAREGARAARGGERGYAVERAGEVLEGGLGRLAAGQDVKVHEAEGRMQVTVSASLPSLVPFLHTLPVAATGSARREAIPETGERGAS
jgi:Flp pilus assembly protein TadG